MPVPYPFGRKLSRLRADARETRRAIEQMNESILKTIDKSCAVVREARQVLAEADRCLTRR
jgi:hypothetical protein